MLIPSNLYAEKVFAEQPLAVWPLDDKLDYVSLMSNSKRNLLATGGDSWVLDNGTVSASSKTGPITTTPCFEVEGDEPSGSSKEFVTLTSSTLFNLSSLNQDLGSFSVSTYIYRDFANVNSIEIGYQIGSATPVFGASKSLISNVGVWALVSDTFAITQTSGNVKAVIRVGYIPTEADTYVFELSGITAGQWSEQFQKDSLGVELVTTPSAIAMTQTSAVAAGSYGFGESSGYYLHKNNKLGARNFGVPMVYGSSSVTSLNTISGPSIIIPGFGFLNEAGQYRDLTLEFWLRVDSGSSQPRKLCGPITSDDGLYIDGAFLKVKINNEIGSFFVGEWSRPMLIDFSVTNNSANVMINGEQVVSMSFNKSDLVFPSNFDGSGRSQDWLGFYAYDDVAPMQVDAIAIYPYLVNGIVAKRRFVYGQGTEIPQNINSSYSTSSVVVDYSFANYSNNYNYPNFGKWENGVVNNLVSQSGALSVPDYQLPAITFSNKTNSEWLSDLAMLQTQENSFVCMRPGSSWSQTDGHILFPSLNILNQKTAAIYGTFVKTNTSTTRETIFRILDITTSNYLDVSLEGTKLLYRFYSGNQEVTLLELTNVVKDNEFSVGLEIDKFSKYFGKQLPSFFNGGSQLSFYVGGTREFSNTFSGNIYTINFCNAENFLPISSDFSEKGVLNYSQTLLNITVPGTYNPNTDYFDESSNYWETAFGESGQNFVGKTASYSLFLNKFLSSYYLDVAISGSWKDYVPLSYLSKYVKNANNQGYYSLDFLQINLDNPAVNTSEALVKSYVTFQSLKTGAYQPDSYYTQTQGYDESGAIFPEGTWATTKYEFKNGSIVYPPLGANVQDLAVGISLEFTVRGILKSPIRLKSLEIASQSYSDLQPTGILTKYGIPIFPYTKNGIYFDYKKRNPVAVYKGSSPHLYLTKNSGIKLLGDQKIGVSRGVSMPINQSSATAYNVGALQFFARYDKDLFPQAAEELFEVESSDRYIKFYVQATDSTRKRGKVYAFNTRTGRVEQGVLYSLNGLESSSLVIDSKQWFVVGIQFSTPLAFNGIQGAFRLTGPMVINNVSHYKFTAFQQNQVSVARPWVQVAAPGGTAQDWQYWEDDFTWDEVLYVLSLQKKLIDLKEIYKAYTGTNKQVISNNSVFRINNYQYSTYDDVLWQTQTTNAV